MSLEFNFEFDKKQVKKATKNLRKELAKTNRLLKVIGAAEVKDAQHRIRSTKQDPDGKKWRPWSYATLQQRTRQGNAGKGLLNNSGRLLRSFSMTVRNGVLKIVNRARYAGYLQKGTRNMPAREILGWSKKSINRLEKKVLSLIKKGWK